MTDIKKNTYWFSHDADATSDPKIMALIERYGYEGYGRFWAIVEMLRKNDRYTIDLRLNYNRMALVSQLKIDPITFDDFLSTIVNEFQLFVIQENNLYSPSLLRRMEKMEHRSKINSENRAKRKPKEPISEYSNDRTTIVLPSSGNKLNKTNKTKESKQTNKDDFARDFSPATQPETQNEKPEEKNEDQIPYKEIVDDLNEKCGTSYKYTGEKIKALIKARWNEGFRLEQFVKVHSTKATEWLKNPEMSKFLRPETLYSNKFESYLNQPLPISNTKAPGNRQTPSEEKYCMDIWNSNKIGDTEEDEVSA